MSTPIDELTFEKITVDGKAKWLCSNGRILPYVAGGSDAGTPAPAPAPDAPAVPQTPEDYKALYEAEAKKTADLITQRNFLKPAQRMLEGLDQDQRDELIALGQLAAKGDREAIAQWAEQTLEAVTGNDLATLIAARQKAAEKGEDPPAALTPEQIEAIVDARTEQRLQAQRAADEGERAVRAEFETLGYKWGSAQSKTILQHAVDNNLNVKEAADWYENDTKTTAAEKNRAAAAAAAQVPGTAPNGVPTGAVPDRQAGETDMEYGNRRARARLTNSPTN